MKGRNPFKERRRLSYPPPLGKGKGYLSTSPLTPLSFKGEGEGIIPLKTLKHPLSFDYRASLIVK